jgi:hypothetical protein
LEKCAAKKQEITTTSLGQADTHLLRYDPNVFKMPRGYIKYVPLDRSPSFATMDLDLTLSDCKFLVQKLKLKIPVETLQAILDGLDKAVFIMHLSESEISSKFNTIFEFIKLHRSFDRKLVLKVFDEVNDTHVNLSSYSAI